MSFWTYVTGVIEVEAFGRTNSEVRYILDTVLEHLPVVSGSEGEMRFEAKSFPGHNIVSSRDEFGLRTNNATSEYGKSRTYGRYCCQTQYRITVHGALRDRMFDRTFHEFMKWLCRLSKRVYIKDLCVKIEDDMGRHVMISDPHPYESMYEFPSWANDTGKPCWWEYLVWQTEPNDERPLEHAVLFGRDKEITAEYDRRRKWREEFKKK